MISNPCGGAGDALFERDRRIEAEGGAGFGDGELLVKTEEEHGVAGEERAAFQVEQTPGGFEGAGEGGGGGEA